MAHDDPEAPVSVEAPDWPLTINERLASSKKPRPLFGGGISAHTAQHNLPRHFGKSVEAIMKARNDEYGSI